MQTQTIGTSTQPHADHDPRARVAPFRRCANFATGRVVITPGAAATLAAAYETETRYLVAYAALRRWAAARLCQSKRIVPPLVRRKPGP